jgi:hypothetical protein
MNELQIKESKIINQFSSKFLNFFFSCLGIFELQITRRWSYLAYPVGREKDLQYYFLWRKGICGICEPFSYHIYAT